MVCLEDIQKARKRLAGVLISTPLLHSHALSRLTGRKVLLKMECFQRTGSFKIRGAYNMVSQLPPKSPVVAGSAGNHAQGVALAAAESGAPCVIYMPENASLPKIEAAQSYGADVRFVPGGVDDAIVAAENNAAETGAVYVPPFDDPMIIAGQGTLGLELVEEAVEAEVVVASVGGGGLLAGVATAVRSLRPDVKVFGVEATGAPAMRASLDMGHPVVVDSVSTIADGIAVGSCSRLTYDHVQRYADDVLLVSDEEIAEASLLLLERAKAVIEPAGAAAFAPVLFGRIPGTGPVVSILSGGNVDPLLLTRLVDYGLSVAGRYLIVVVQLPDLPGTFARLAGFLAELRVNLVNVEHYRAGLRLPVNTAQVVLHLETRDKEHAAQVLDALRASGYDAVSQLV